METLNRAYLLERLLRWYAILHSSENSTYPIPYSASSPTTIELSKYAQKACAARHNGQLLVVVCDMWNIPLNLLAGSANIPNTLLSIFINSGYGISIQEEDRIAQALDSIIVIKTG
jgi:hypothetical protein